MKTTNGGVAGGRYRTRTRPSLKVNQRLQSLLQPPNNNKEPRTRTWSRHCSACRRPSSRVSTLKLGLLSPLARLAPRTLCGSHQGSGFYPSLRCRMLIKEPLLWGIRDKMAADSHRDAVNTSVHQAAAALFSDQCGHDVYEKRTLLLSVNAST